MKTAMMELIDSLKNTNMNGEHDFAINKATELLEKEKEQIKNAFDAKDKFNTTDPRFYENYEQYYNQTYNS